ncbi:MAG: cell division FtsA domain-containing protein [Candidatus Omnitrophica bacterium]|nr:cell division FtsA domain-containing protein [Candidatus Omnitrophota bacterium]
MKNNFICAVDLGSSKLSAIVCVFNKQGKIIDMSMESAPSRGIKGGRIVDFSDLSSNLESLLKKLEKAQGSRIKEFYTNVSGNEISTAHSRAIIPLAERGNRVITDADIFRVKEQARILGTSLQEEIIHEIPFGYIVDTDNFCSDPRELYAHRLEIDLYLIYAKLSHIQSLTRMAHQLGFSIKGIFYSGLISAKLALGESIRRATDIFCDIGADMTDLVFFKNNILQSLQVLPIGGDEITSAIARGLSIPFELAEEIKRSSAVIGKPEDLPAGKEVMVNKGSNYMPIKQREISRIATESAAGMCRQIKEAIDKVAPANTINNLFISGRTVIQEGFLEKLEEVTGIPTRLVRIPGHLFINNEIHNELTSSYMKMLTYLNAFGLVTHAAESTQENNILRQVPTLKPLSGVINKVKQVYQQYF